MLFVNKREERAPLSNPVSDSMGAPLPILSKSSDSPQLLVISLVGSLTGSERLDSSQMLKEGRPGKSTSQQTDDSNMIAGDFILQCPFGTTR